MNIALVARVSSERIVVQTGGGSILLDDVGLVALERGRDGRPLVAAMGAAARDFGKATAVETVTGNDAFRLEIAATVAAAAAVGCWRRQRNGVQRIIDRVEVSIQIEGIGELDVASRKRVIKALPRIRQIKWLVDGQATGQ